MAQVIKNTPIINSQDPDFLCWKLTHRLVDAMQNLLTMLVCRIFMIRENRDQHNPLLQLLSFSRRFGKAKRLSLGSKIVCGVSYAKQFLQVPELVSIPSA